MGDGEKGPGLRRDGNHPNRRWNERDGDSGTRKDDREKESTCIGTRIERTARNAVTSVVHGERVEPDETTRIDRGGRGVRRDPGTRTAVRTTRRPSSPPDRSRLHGTCAAEEFNRTRSSTHNGTGFSFFLIFRIRDRTDPTPIHLSNYPFRLPKLPSLDLSDRIDEPHCRGWARHRSKRKVRRPRCRDEEISVERNAEAETLGPPWPTFGRPMDVTTAT